MSRDRFKEALAYSVEAAERFPCVREIWLYGSYAREDHHPFSDIDLFVVTDDPIGRKEKLALKNSLVSDDYTLPEADVHFGTMGQDQAVASASSAEKIFLDNVRKDGKLVHRRK